MRLFKDRPASVWARSTRIAVATGLIGSVVGAVTLFGPAGVAGAGPIDMANNDRAFATGPTASTTVPAGACKAEVRVRGTKGDDVTDFGTGGNANFGAGTGGAGADIRATFRVTPGQAVEFLSGSGGEPGYSSLGGGTSGDGGAARGVRIGGTLALVAGGGNLPAHDAGVYEIPGYTGPVRRASPDRAP